MTKPAVDEVMKPKDLQRLLRSIRTARRITVAMLLLLVASLLYLALQLLERPRLPESLQANLRAGQRHQIDVLLLDEPEIGSQALEAALRPLLMVAQHRMPDRQQHFRIIFSRSGFPGNFDGSGVGAAGYDPTTDVFVVDCQAVKGSWGKNQTNEQVWAFVMAHEAMHLWQKERGDLTAHGGSRLHDPDAYIKDPIELEAYQEGVSVASALPNGIPFAWTFRDGTSILPLDPNPYVGSMLNVADVADLRVHRQKTPLGFFRQIKSTLWSDSWAGHENVDQ